MSEPTPTGSFNYYINSISGIWNSYGCIPNPGESISFYLEDAPADGQYSLVDLMGFDRTHKDIGQIAKSKEIKEIVVMLPMVEKYKQPLVILPPTTPVFTPPPDPCAPCKDNLPDPCEDLIGEVTITFEDYKGLKYCRTEDAWLFVISEKIINKILDVDDYKKYSIYVIKDILEKRRDLNRDNNIVKLMIAMVNYNIPPHLNWLAFPDKVPPFAFYVAEFSSNLNQNDLSNIWQGSMPKLAQEPEMEEVSIEHYLIDEEIFGGYNIVEDFEDVKLKVFKCKKRANNDYYGDLILDNKYINPKNIFLSSNNKVSKLSEKPWYQYNWPYDNFSLIELLKIEESQIHDYEVTDIDAMNVSGSTVIKYTAPAY